MERLPYIDEISITAPADLDATWSALVAAMGATSRSPIAHYARLVGADPVAARGDWDGRRLRPGATVPGFAVDDAQAPHRLRLTGRHRFARYALTFRLEPASDPAVTPATPATTAAPATRITAETRAAFPGVLGRAYRALVITSGGHRIAVHRMLRGVRGRAAR